MGHGGSLAGLAGILLGPVQGVSLGMGTNDWIEGICGSSHRRLWKHVRSYPGRTDHRAFA